MLPDCADSSDGGKGIDNAIHQWQEWSCQRVPAEYAFRVICEECQTFGPNIQKAMIGLAVKLGVRWMASRELEEDVSRFLRSVHFFEDAMLVQGETDPAPRNCADTAHEVAVRLHNLWSPAVIVWVSVSAVFTIGGAGLHIECLCPRPVQV